MKYSFLCLALSFSVFAELIGSVVIDFSQGYSTSHYYLSDIETNTYTQNKSFGMTKTVISGSELLAFLSLEEESELSDIPGVTSKGHSKLKVSKRGDRYFLTTDIVSYSEINGSEVEIPINYVSEVTFLEGNWKDYLNGKRVVFQYTESAKKLLLEVLKSKLKLASVPLKQQLEDNGLKPSELELVSADLGDVKVVIENDEVVLYQTPLSLKLKLDILI